MKDYDGAFNRRSNIVFHQTAYWGKAVPLEITGTAMSISNEARIKFGADLYSEAFKRGLKGEVVTSDPDSPAKKELPYEACGSFGDIDLGECTGTGGQ